MEPEPIVFFCAVGCAMCFVVFLYSIFPPHHDWGRLLHDALNQHKCHLIPTPLAGSLPPASNSAFNISQPKAGHQQWSCHAVLSEQTLPPQTLSACKAAVIQPWNLPTSQTRSIISPLSFSLPPSAPLFSLPLRHTAILCVLEHLYIATSFFRLSPASPISIHFPLPSSDLLPRPRGLTQLWDTSCSFNDFAPRPRSAREIQLPFFDRMRTLTPATPLQNMCVWICMWVRMMCTNI